MTLREDSPGVLAGAVRFGTAPPPPPVANYDVGYPPNGNPMLGVPAVVEGFNYLVRDARVTGRRLQVALTTRELWADWCSHQHSYPTDGMGTFLCVPGNVAMHVATATGEVCLIQGQAFDCRKLDLCFGGVCRCDQSGCQADLQPDLQLDLWVTGDDASGTSSGRVGGNVHFTRGR
jgi:hypothetical protein